MVKCYLKCFEFHGCYLDLDEEGSWAREVVFEVVFSGDSDGKESASNVGDPGLITGSGRSPGEGNGNPLQYSCLEKSHGQRSLSGYSSRGHKELRTTNPLTFSEIMKCSDRNIPLIYKLTSLKPCLPYPPVWPLHPGSYISLP